MSADNIDVTEMDKVIARVQKLLSRTKTGSGTSEAEAETAMRLAQELLSKYNLDMAEIEARSDAATTAVERVKEESRSGTRFKWQRQLAKYVAETNFCYHLIRWASEYRDDRYELCMQEGDHEDHTSPACFKYGDEGGDKTAPYKIHIRGGYKSTPHHVFVGRKANVITAQLMFRYLIETIEELVPVENKQRLSRSAQSWKEGCADRLCERLAQKRKDLIEEHDARVKLEEEARKAEAQAAYEAKNKVKPLPPNEAAEVNHAINEMKKGARDRTGDKKLDEDQERPEVDAADDWNPADAEETPEEESSTALVLASVYDKNEMEANYEAAHGLEPGYLARRRKEQEEYEAAREKEAAAEEAKAETEEVDKPIKEETEKQRLRREAREEKEHMKNRRRWAREDRAAENRAWREHQKRDHKMYDKGNEAGSKIGLDLQVAAPRDAKKLTSGGDK